LKSLRQALARHHRIGIDTGIFIYFIEENPEWIDEAAVVFEWLLSSGNSGVTSTLTMTELLVQPYRLGRTELVDQFYALLSTYPNLEWVAPTLEISDLAARLRAEHGIRTPDATQAATAIERGATALVSNDAAFSRLTVIESIILHR
jgi:predicted nucleic acid-binding protein